MKKLNLSIVIPTRNRADMLNKTLKHLSVNRFFFKEIVIVDSSDKIQKTEIKLLKNFKKLNIKIFDSKPSISLQRNIGLKHVNKKIKYVMFLDDDLCFQKNALKNMFYFVKRKKNMVGFGFNLIIKDINNFTEFLKKNKFMKLLGIYDFRDGVVTQSGWQTKAINLKKNKFVEWMPTQAVIYKNDKIKNLRFDKAYGRYSYLEDLDFSYSLKKKGNLVICSNAKYSSNNTIKRNPYLFGVKEIVNRFYFVKKFNLNNFSFLVGCLFLIIKHLILFFTLKPSYFLRIAGNFSGLLKIIF
jgi:glycosyltransferase involved in cell wall biosynthesis